jgi:hypothetical protein
MTRTGAIGIAGIIGAAIGGFMGYREALVTDGVEAWMGALIFGAVGLILGSLGGLLIRGASAVILYILLLGVLGFVFRDQIEMMTGTDPVEAVTLIIEDCLAFIQGKIAERRVE